MWKTCFLPLAIAISEDRQVIIQIDGACSAYSYGYGYSGLFVTTGQGDIIEVSKKLVLVINSST